MSGTAQLNARSTSRAGLRYAPEDSSAGSVIPRLSNTAKGMRRAT